LIVTTPPHSPSDSLGPSISLRRPSIPDSPPTTILRRDNRSRPASHSTPRTSVQWSSSCKSSYQEPSRDLQRSVSSRQTLPRRVESIGGVFRGEETFSLLESGGLEEYEAAREFPWRLSLASHIGEQDGRKLKGETLPNVDSALRELDELIGDSIANGKSKRTALYIKSTARRDLDASSTSSYRTNTSRGGSVGNDYDRRGSAGLRYLDAKNDTRERGRINPSNESSLRSSPSLAYGHPPRSLGLHTLHITRRPRPASSFSGTSGSTSPTTSSSFPRLPATSSVTCDRWPQGLCRTRRASAPQPYVACLRIHEEQQDRPRDRVEMVSQETQTDSPHRHSSLRLNLHLPPPVSCSVSSGPSMTTRTTSSDDGSTDVKHAKLVDVQSPTSPTRMARVSLLPLSGALPSSIVERDGRGEMAMDMERWGKERLLERMRALEAEKKRLELVIAVLTRGARGD
jgi:hypothetical protein